MADLSTIAGTLAARSAGATELEKNKTDSLRFGLDLNLRDVETARAAQYAMRREWCASEPEKFAPASSHVLKAI